MKAHATKKPVHNTSPANVVFQQKHDSSAITQFADLRPEAVQMQNLEEMANNSIQIQQAVQLQQITNQPVPVQKKENNTGIPDELKTGLENLSGYSLDDVKVHYNSAKPIQLNALAYAQGTDIHLATGQERHLPHEAWHVIQQKQGRVKPTMQMKGKININDDAGLEKEADIMGNKALRKNISFPLNPTISPCFNNNVEVVTQRFLAAGDSYFDSDDFVIVNDIGQFLKRGHVVVKISDLSSVKWPENERMLVITGHGDENSLEGRSAESIAGIISASSVPESIPIVLLSCNSAKEREDGSNFTKEVYDTLGHKRTISGFKGAAILDASSEVMKIVSIAHDKEELVGEQQQFLEQKHKPQESINKLASEASSKDQDFYTSAIESSGLSGFFNDFLQVINSSIDQTGCVTYIRH